LTRAKVLQIGLGILLLGVLGYWSFRFIGLEGYSAGIAAQTILVLIVFGWTCSYLLRVATGNMTFMEQRKRYREDYDKLTEAELQSKFDSLSKKEQELLLKEQEND
tara:strand:+ start:358 stop:675 length:318 start_codon:yes stop_codon:yes gene_type:complete